MNDPQLLRNPERVAWMSQDVLSMETMERNKIWATLAVIFDDFKRHAYDATAEL